VKSENGERSLLHICVCEHIYFSWRCKRFRNGKCGARLITIDDRIVNETNRIHTHEPEGNALQLKKEEMSDAKFIIYNE
jgi:hypothetical protein